MNKKNILWWLGLIIAVLTAIMSYCSCTTAEHFTRSNGHTSIITTDTTDIYHGGNLTIKIK